MSEFHVISQRKDLYGCGYFILDSLLILHDCNRTVVKLRDNAKHICEQLINLEFKFYLIITKSKFLLSPQVRY